MTEPEPAATPEENRPLTGTKIRWLRRRIAWARAVSDFSDRILAGIKSHEQLFVISAAILIGFMGGFIAAGFRTLIGVFQGLLWGNGDFVQTVRAAPVYMKLLIPAGGGAVVAAIVYVFAREAKGHGVPEVMDAVATKNGFIRMRVVFVKAVVSALCIGSGGSVGREGPIVQVGSAFGSAVGQILQVSRKRIRTFVGCGAAAGIAATFNAPIAGAIFASEIILGDFSIASIGPIMISSVLATVVSRGIYGGFPAFVPPLYILQSPVELVFYGILGVAAGLVALAFVRTLYYTEDLFDKFNVNAWSKALVGGVILGSLALFAPEIMGVGYGTIGTVLTGKFTLGLALLLLVTKILATSLTLGSGGSGGIFAPSLFIGAMLGSFLGGMFHSLFPEITASSGAYALVGMAAVVAAATHAPITGILIIFEMTSEYTVILPLMISSIIATFIKMRLLEGSIYTIKLERKGVHLHGGRDVGILRKLNVGNIMQQRVETIGENEPVEALLSRMSISASSNFCVVDEEGQLQGTVTMGMIRRFLNRYEEIPRDYRVKDLYEGRRSTITTITPVDEALKIMSAEDVDSLPVVDDKGEVAGQLLRSDVMREYQELLLQDQTADSMASGISFVHRYTHEKTEVIPGFLMARIDVPSQFVNRSVHELEIRRNFNVDVLLIRRTDNGAYENLIPTPHMRLSARDQIVIFGERSAVERVCALDR